MAPIVHGFLIDSGVFRALPWWIFYPILFKTTRCELISRPYVEQYSSPISLFKHLTNGHAETLPVANGSIHAVRMWESFKIDVAWFMQFFDMIHQG